MKKHLGLTTALVLGTLSPVFAGGIEPTMEPEVVAAATVASSQDFIVPLMLLVLIATAASGSGGGGGAASDIRLKTDVRSVGMTPQGLPLYQWRYAGLPQVWQGVMAQDVAVNHGHAIRPLAFGYMAVDYAALGLTLQRVH